MMTHDDAVEMLASLALDAVSAEERVELEDHVATCARCQRELDQFRDVAAALGNSVEPLPEGLWTSIADALHSGVDAPRADSPPDHSTQRPELAVIQSIDGRARRRRLGFASIVGAAAAALIVLSLSLASADHRADHLQSELRGANGRAVAAALATPGHRIVDLGTGAHPALAEFVVLPNGSGYLVNSELPVLVTSSTYQLWGIVRGKPISLAVMGSSPTFATFTLVGAPTETTLGITIEPAGGSPTPTTAIVAESRV